MYCRDKQPLMLTVTPMGTLELPVNLICRLLGCGSWGTRKSPHRHRENPEPSAKGCNSLFLLHLITVVVPLCQDYTNDFNNCDVTKHQHHWKDVLLALI